MIVVKSKQYEETVSVYIENLSNVKVGDEVKATGSMMRKFTEYMVATDVENTKNKLGMHFFRYQDLILKKIEKLKGSTY